jgi:hypothetical protein
VAAVLHKVAISNNDIDERTLLAAACGMGIEGLC